MSKKTVQFDYFEVLLEVENEDGSLKEERYDITRILEKANKLSPKKTTLKYRGEKARIQNAEYDKERKIWELQFLRLRENCPPGIADEEGDFEVVPLEDGKYVGEFASALYDAENCILVLHRNRDSLTPSGVEEYLLRSINEKRGKIKLNPIIRQHDVKKLLSNKKVYKKITLGLSTDNFDNIDDNTHLGGLLKGLSKYEGASVKIEISVGRAKRERTLAPGLVDEAIAELYKDNATRKLEIKYKENPDTITEKVDLLNDRVKDEENFEIDRKNPLKHEHVYPSLRTAYVQRKRSGKIY